MFKESEHQNKLSPEQRTRLAKDAITFLSTSIKNAENVPWVDLGKPAFSKLANMTVDSEEKTKIKDVTLFESIKAFLEVLRDNIDYLTPDEKEQAEALIIKAELYLANHDE